MSLTDLYSLRARVQPTIMVALPVALVVYAFLPDYVLFVTAFFGLLGAAGGNDLIADMGRKRGYDRQDDLWNSWGGAPTTRLLRHRHTPGDITLEPGMRHQIEDWLKYRLPTEQDEQADPEAADAQYKQATSTLIEATRDTARFPLVFAELTNYGFRRNLWGLRPIGVSIAIVFASISGAVFALTIQGRPWPEPWWNILADYDSKALIWILVGLANTAVAAIWMFMVKSSWVKIAADTYAKRLMESVQTLGRA